MSISFCGSRLGFSTPQGVKANILFFDRKPASEKPWTTTAWIYDFRTNEHFTLKTNPLKRADIYTNSIESAFSLLKCGMIGQFHKLSAKHLHRYLSEFEYRFNGRKNDDLFIQTVQRLCRVAPLRFSKLTS